MRILQINDYPLEDGGGAEVVIARTIELLRNGGADVALFTAADLPDRRPGVRRYLDNPIARRALSERLRTYRPDVVHLHNFYHVLSPGILAELERYRADRPLRVVMTVHDYHLICPNSGGTWYPRRSALPAAIEALANLDGRGVVIDAEEDQVSRAVGGRVAGGGHGAVNLWTAEN